MRNIGFGSAALANGPAWDWTTRISEAQALECVQHAYMRGIRFFDTAPSYGGGEVERRMGVALAGLPRDTFSLATKVGYTRDGDSIHYDYSRDGVLRSLDASMKRLRTDHVDFVHIHDPDHHVRQALDETFPTLAELRAQRVIRAVSIGINDAALAQTMLHGAAFDMVMIAGRYTLLEQGALPLLDYCAQQGIAVLAAAVYNSGILATGADDPNARYNHAPASDEVRARVRVLETMCMEFSVALGTAALQFPLAHPAVRSAVVGFQTKAEIDRCLTALETSIPSAFWEQLQTASLLDNRVPIPVGKAMTL